MGERARARAKFYCLRMTRAKFYSMGKMAIARVKFYSVGKELELGQVLQHGGRGPGQGQVLLCGQGQDQVLLRGQAQSKFYSMGRTRAKFYSKEERARARAKGLQGEERGLAS